jgi:hypothetical protein
MTKDVWKDNSIQFPRLIAEIVATVDINAETWQNLCDSMDLTTDELNELFDRAQESWEKIKGKT